MPKVGHEAGADGGRGRISEEAFSSTCFRPESDRHYRPWYRELIDRALTVTGPVAEVRDTRAIVRLALDQAERAVKDLQEAVREKAVPRAVKFHLAQAHLRCGDRKEAARVFAEARTSGLEPEGLHPLERTAYARLQEALEGR